MDEVDRIEAEARLEWETVRQMRFSDLTWEKIQELDEELDERYPIHCSTRYDPDDDLSTDDDENDDDSNDDEDGPEYFIKDVCNKKCIQLSKNIGRDALVYPDFRSRFAGFRSPGF